MMRTLFVTTVTAALLAQPLAAQESKPSASTENAASQQLSQQDSEFAKKAAAGGMLEVRLGELATQQAQNPDVTDFGRMMVEDHGQANQKLQDIARQKGIQLPQDLSEEGRRHYEELQQLSGAQFDHHYIVLMVKDHHEDVDAFQKQADAGQDPEFVAFAEETLPTLQQHLDRAEAIQKQVVTAAGQQQGQQDGQQQAAAQRQTQVEVTQQPPQIVVQEKQPKVTVETAQPEVIVRQPEPKVTIDQPAPEVTVKQAEPQVTVREAEPEVTVKQAKPQVEVQQAQPEVAVRQEKQTPEPQGVARTEQQGRDTGAEQERMASTAPGPYSVDELRLRANEIIGRSVYNLNDEQIGDVEDLVVNPQDQQAYAIIGVGGFLGIGEKNLAIPFDELEIQEDRVVILSQRSEEELKNQPPYEEGSWVPIQ